jgi:hypothetical protein
MSCPSRKATSGLRPPARIRPLAAAFQRGVRWKGTNRKVVGAATIRQS